MRSALAVSGRRKHRHLFEKLEVLVGIAILEVRRSSFCISFCISPMRPPTASVFVSAKPQQHELKAVRHEENGLVALFDTCCCNPMGEAVHRAVHLIEGQGSALLVQYGSCRSVRSWPDTLAYRADPASLWGSEARNGGSQHKPFVSPPVDAASLPHTVLFHWPPNASEAHPESSCGSFDHALPSLPIVPMRQTQVKNSWYRKLFSIEILCFSAKQISDWLRCGPAGLTAASGKE